MKLTDTHLVLLSAAAQHRDHLLPRPDQINGRAAQLLAAKLVKSGLVQEMTVRTDQPHWRVQGQVPVGLRITREGLVALGLEEAGGAPAPAPDQQAGRDLNRAPADRQEDGRLTQGPRTRQQAGSRA